MNRVYSVQATSEPRPPSLPRILGIVRFLSVLRFKFIEWPCQDKPEGLLGYSNCIQLGSPTMSSVWMDNCGRKMDRGGEGKSARYKLVVAGGMRPANQRLMSPNHHLKLLNKFSVSHSQS